MPVFLGQGPMNNGAPLNKALTAVIAGVNAAGGKASYLDMRGPPTDGEVAVFSTSSFKALVLSVLM